MNADLIHQTAMEYALDKSQETLDKAITAALPLSYAIAARFSGRGIETEDLRQVAAMALVSALNNFDPERGLRFTTYVTPTITGTLPLCLPLALVVATTESDDWSPLARTIDDVRDEYRAYRIANDVLASTFPCA